MMNLLRKFGHSQVSVTLREGRERRAAFGPQFKGGQPGNGTPRARPNHDWHYAQAIARSASEKARHFFLRDKLRTEGVFRNENDGQASGVDGAKDALLEIVSRADVAIVPGARRIETNRREMVAKLLLPGSILVAIADEELEAAHAARPRRPELHPA
jgi:hypothetical protein